MFSHSASLRLLAKSVDRDHIGRVIVRVFAGPSESLNPIKRRPTVVYFDFRVLDARPEATRLVRVTICKPNPVLVPRSQSTLLSLLFDNSFKPFIAAPRSVCGPSAKYCRMKINLSPPSTPFKEPLVVVQPYEKAASGKIIVANCAHSGISASQCMVAFAHHIANSQRTTHSSLDLRTTPNPTL